MMFFLDILFFDQTIGKVDLYRNLTNGSLSNPIQIINQFTRIYGMDVADLDNDGLIDIVASSLHFHKIVWFKNLGISGFGDAQFIASSNVNDWSLNLTILDYNQDGNNDVFYIPQESKQLMMVTNLGSGTFSTPVQIDYYSSMSNFDYTPFLSTFDINQDGTEDLIVNTDISGDNIVWYEVTSGVLSSRHELAGFGGIIGSYEPFMTFSVDLNLDGFNEIVLADWNDVFYFPNNNGIISSTKVGLISNTISYIANMSIADYNADGYPDFMIHEATSGISYYKNNTSFGFINTQSLSPEVFMPMYVISPDIDSDGLNDIVYYINNSLKINWLKNEGSGNFSPTQQILSVPTAPLFFTPSLKKIANADIDNDGVDDLITLKGTSSTSHLEYFKNQSNLSFGTPVAIMSSYRIWDFTTCDLDNDNDLDILYSSMYNDVLGFFTNLGSGNFSTEQIIDNTLNDPTQITTVNFDNDSDLDIVCITIGDDKIRTYENLGNSTFGIPTIISSQSFSGIYQILGDDVDGDSLKDIILCANGQNKVSWFKNQGSGSFSSQIMISTTMNSPVIQPIDYDNDGDLDILCTSNYVALETTGTYLLENIGNGNFLSDGPKIMTYPALNFTKSDFDLDGDIDFASCNGRIFYTELKLNNKTTVKGKVFFDLNSNGILDLTDVGMNQIKVNTNPIVNYVFSDSEGNYQINLFDSTQVYNIFASTLTNWGLTSTPSTYNVSVDSNFTILDSVNFGFSPSIISDSITTSLVGGFPRCNQIVNYWVNVENLGTTIPSGIISLHLDDSLTFISATPTPDSISSGNLYWSFDNLFYFNDTLINLQVEMPDFLSMGDTLISNVETTILDGLNNILFISQDVLSQTLVCAYDPNDKNSTPSGLGYSGLVSSEIDEVEYLIRFQNTGNDTALVITIKDQLDQKLNWSSMNPICGSHDYTASIDPNGLLTFTFNNINLPDSNTNELASHGFILYKIKMNDNLPIGSIIENHANIYFDYNPAIITNHKVLTLFDCTSLFEGVPQPNLYYCVGDSVQFGVEFPQTVYHWTNTFMDIDSIDQSVSIMTDSLGLYVVEINAKNSICDIDSTVQFTVSIPPITSLGSITICPGDSALIFNQYQITAGFYYDTLQTQQGCDSIIVHELLVDGCIGMDEFHIIDISVFPNPTDGKLYLNFSEPLNGDLFIYDLSGKICFFQNFHESQNIVVNIEGEPGVYFLETKAEEKVKSVFKLIKE